MLRQRLSPQGAHAGARHGPVQVQLLREAAQEQDLAGGTRETTHGREALPLLDLCGRLCFQQRARTAHEGRAQGGGQRRHDGLGSEGEAEIGIA